MVDKKTMMANLDKVGAIISEAKKSKTALTSEQVNECRTTLKSATASLFSMKALTFRAGKSVQMKQAAVQKSITESLISKEDGDKEMATAATASEANQTQMKRIMSALESVRKLVAEINTLAASPRNEQLDKGVDTSAQIKAPEKATASVEAAKKRKESFRKFIEARKAARIKKASGEAVVSHQTEKDPKGNTDELDHAAHMSAAPSTSPQIITGNKEKARRMYMSASAMLKKAEAEKDEAKKAMLQRRASVLEKMGDSLAAKIQAAVKAVTASTEKKATDQTKEAATVVFAANDQVLLPDGVVGNVSAVNGDQMTVSVAGVTREVLVSTCKKITSGKEEKKAGTDPVAAPAAPVKEQAPVSTSAPAAPAAPVSASIADRVKSAIGLMRTGKKTAAPVDAPVAKSPDAPKPEAKVMPKEAPKAMAPQGAGSPVSAVDAKTIAFVDGIGWTVNVSANEVKSFGDDKAAAESFVAKASLDKTAKEGIFDSADPKASSASEGVASKMKGLDMGGKDYGTTKADEKVNEQFSMIKKSTAQTKDSPVDSATTTAPEQVVMQNKLKGLDQGGKGYTSTTTDQKVNPQFSAIARKNQILANTVNEQKVRLSTVEATLLVDRAVKVGAVPEGQRSEQETVMAELYRNSPAEFNAYGRLIANLETNSGKKDIATRTVDRVKAAMENKGSLVVTGSVGTSSASLESGNFFDEM